MATNLPARRTGIFRTIWRINAVFILTVGIACALALCIGVVALVWSLIANFMPSSARAPAPRSAAPAGAAGEDPALLPIKWELGTMETVRGTPWRMLPQSESSDDKGGRFKLGSYDKYGREETRNYLFLNTDDLSRHFLLPNSDAVLLSADRIGEGTATRKMPVRWIEYRTVRADTNGDGRLNANDRFEIAYSDASGKNYGVCLMGVDEVLGAEMHGLDRRLIIYRKQDSLFAALLDIPARRIVRQEPVPTSSSLD